MSITEETHIPVWTLGERLTKAREHAGISIDDMADRLGVSSKTIRNWENEAVRITRATLLAYSAETSVPLEWIVDDPDARSRCSSHPFSGDPDAEQFELPLLFAVAA